MKAKQMVLVDTSARAHEQKNTLKIESSML